jgi:drug/metabolite transporter (DMT)-like permease
MSPLKRFLMTLALTALWSPSFLFIKLAVADLPPFTIAFLRVTIAAFFLFIILRLMGRQLPKDKQFWGHAAVLSFFSSVLPFSLFCYAEQSIDSALAALLNGGTPMFTALLAHTFLPSDRLTLQKSVGVGCSFIGLLWLFAPNIALGLSGTTTGMIAATIASIGYAISHIYAKKYVMGQPPLVVPTAQLMAAALFLFLPALFIDAPYQLPMPSMSAMLGVGGLALFGTTIAFVIYYRLLEHSGPTAISMVACFFPVMGMLLGFLFLGETLSLNGLLAASLILLGMMLVNGVIKLPVFLQKPLPTAS